VVDLNDDNLRESASFGEQLKAAREEAGLRLDDIVAETKVSRGILTALEEGRFRRLPERVFSRSFVAQYAHVVGADEQALLSAFDTAWDGYTASSGTHPNLEVIVDDLGPSIRWRFWIPIAAGVLILIGAGVVILRGSSSIDEVLAPDPRRSGVRRAEMALATELAVKPTPLMQLEEEAVDDIEALVELTLRVGSGKESWVHYRDREGMTGQSLLTDGDVLSLELAGPVKLTIGNAGAVVIGVGGRTFSDLGLPGQVIHTEVTSEGFSRLGQTEAGTP
jgi:cytoskeletal protein RodZ